MELTTEVQDMLTTEQAELFVPATNLLPYRWNYNPPLHLQISYLAIACVEIVAPTAVFFAARFIDVNRMLSMGINSVYTSTWYLMFAGSLIIYIFPVWMLASYIYNRRDVQPMFTMIMQGAMYGAPGFSILIILLYVVSIVTWTDFQSEQFPSEVYT